MMCKVLCILLFLLVNVSHQFNNYRLPNDSIPYHYNLKFTPHIIPGNFTFDGESEIFLEVLNLTKNLTLNSFNLEIHEESTLLIGDEGYIIPNLHIFEEEPQFLVLNFQEYLEPGYYKLQLKYTGKLIDQPHGFFKNFYFNENNEKIYLAATQFETVDARKVFPCWDEPALKATFEISIKHFPNYTALSNMPAQQQLNEIKINGKIWTKFEITPLMSTYLVCFVISDFESITNTQGNFSMWARKNALGSMENGFEVGLLAFPVLEEYTNISYEFPKMDIIALPQFFVGAMENWGLITCNEDILLQDNYTSHEKMLESYQVIVHEIVHQWVGNLVSPAWWKDVWIIEGLTTYLDSFLTAKVINFPRLMDYFIVHNNFRVLKNDEFRFDQPLFRDVNTPKEATKIITEVHHKGATIMHMLSSLTSEDVFHTGIRNILKTYKFKTITTDDFWNTMQEALNESKFHHSKFDIKTVMESYVSQVGYPIVNVFRDYETGVVKLTQECLVCERHNNNYQKSKWWIPINIVRSSSLNFSSTFATHWMNPEEEELIIEGIDPNDWIIINIKSSAYYRVSYDERNWNKISDYLNSDNFLNIHVLNRAQVLEDALWLYQHGRLDRSFLLNITSYLVRELDFIPWFIGHEILCDLLLTNTDNEEFKAYGLRLIEALNDDTDLQLEENPENDFLTKSKNNIEQFWSCKLGSFNCRNKEYD